MPHRLSRRSLLRAGALPVLRGGIVGAAGTTPSSASGDVTVTVRYPPGAARDAADAVAALDGLQIALEGAAASDAAPSLDLAARASERSFQIPDFDDATASVRRAEDAIYGGDGPTPDGSRSVEVVLYRHGLPWQQFDELGGAGFACWRAGVPSATAPPCSTDVRGCRRRYGDVAGPYALAFVNLGIRGLPAQALLATLGYDADAMFANTVLHEVGHCFGVNHDAGTVGVGDAPLRASPMLTWYCEHDAVANDHPGDCCGDCSEATGVLGHEPALSSCARDAIAEHAREHLA